MASPRLIAAVTSDRHRNGKTLLARVLVDFMLLDGRDPYCLDLDHKYAVLRSHFPGRTASVDFSHVPGQMKVFDAILAGPGRDYVIDIPAGLLPRFCEAMHDLDFRKAYEAAGFSFIIFYIVDENETSLKTAAAVEELLAPDLFVPTVNRFVGSALPDDIAGLVLTMEKLDPDLHTIVSYKRFSFQRFLQGEEGGVPMRLRSGLKSFLHRLIGGFREVGPSLSLRNLRG